MSFFLMWYCSAVLALGNNLNACIPYVIANTSCLIVQMNVLKLVLCITKITKYKGIFFSDYSVSG